MKPEVEKASQEAVGIIPARGEVGLDQDHCSGGGKRWLDPGYLLKAEPTGFADSQHFGLTS